MAQQFFLLSLKYHFSFLLIFLLLFVFVYTFAVSLSTWAVLFEEITFHKYGRKRDVLKLLATALAEPFFYPVHTYFAVKGNIDFLRGKKGWGSASRSGFDSQQTKKKGAGRRAQSSGRG